MCKNIVTQNCLNNENHDTVQSFYVHSMLTICRRYAMPTFTINTIIIFQTHAEDVRDLLHGMQTGL